MLPRLSVPNSHQKMEVPEAIHLHWIHCQLSWIVAGCQVSNVSKQSFTLHYFISKGKLKTHSDRNWQWQCQRLKLVTSQTELRMQSSNKRSKRGFVSNPIAQDHNPPRPCNSCSIWSDHWYLHRFLECKGRHGWNKKRVRIGKLWVMKLQQQFNFISSGIVDSDSAKKVFNN